MPPSARTPTVRPAATGSTVASSTTYTAPRVHVPVGRRASGSRTVEYSYNDYAVAQVALAAGDQAGAERYLERSRNWTNLWDPATKSIRPRHAGGAFVADHNGARVYYGSDRPVLRGIRDDLLDASCRTTRRA